MVGIYELYVVFHLVEHIRCVRKLLKPISGALSLNMKHPEEARFDVGNYYECFTGNRRRRGGEVVFILSAFLVGFIQGRKDVGTNLQSNYFYIYIEINMY